MIILHLETGQSNNRRQSLIPSALRCNSGIYRNVGFWNYDPLAPTAANASISGSITTADGQGIRNARLVLVNSSGEMLYAQTGTFGLYRFDDLPVGETHVLTINSNRFVFAQPSVILNLNEYLTDVNFTSEP
ncbi:MAG: carboxypeptidase-like regulatory domain-containing protein [Actinomycetota bacterium]